MANNYMQWSESLRLLEGKPPEARTWLEKALGEQDRVDDDFDYDRDWSGLPSSPLAPWRDHESESINFRARIEEDDLWVFSEDSGDLEATVCLVQSFLRQWGDGTEVFSIQYSMTCDRPRCGEFGGGAVVFTRDKVRWETTDSIVAALKTRLMPSSGPPKRFRLDLTADAVVSGTFEIEAASAQDAKDLFLEKHQGDVSWTYDGIEEGSVSIHDAELIEP